MNGEPTSRATRRRRSLLPAFAIGAIGLAGCVQPSLVPRVGVMNYDNALTEEGSRHFDRAIAEWLTTSLGEDPRLAVIERDEVIQSSYLVDPTDTYVARNVLNLRRVGRRIGADYLIAGSIARLEGNYLLTARLYSVETSSVVPGSAMTRSCHRLEDVYSLVQATAREMADRIAERAERVRRAEQERLDARRGAGSPPPGANTRPPPGGRR
jgi:TolB-like protein